MSSELWLWDSTNWTVVKILSVVWERLRPRIHARWTKHMSIAFGVYVGRGSYDSAYGSLASVVVLFTFISRPSRSCSGRRSTPSCARRPTAPSDSACVGTRRGSANRRGPGTGSRRGGRSRAAGSAPRTLGLDADRLPVGVRAGPRSRVARRTLAVRSGIERQPSRATSAPCALTTCGSTSTSSPAQVVALGWSVTSTTTIRTSSPSCGAARPTQPGWARIVSSRSSATARARSPASCPPARRRA